MCWEVVMSAVTSAASWCQIPVHLPASPGLPMAQGEHLLTIGHQESNQVYFT